MGFANFRATPWRNDGVRVFAAGATVGAGMIQYGVRNPRSGERAVLEGAGMGASVGKGQKLLGSGNVGGRTKALPAVQLGTIYAAPRMQGELQASDFEGQLTMLTAHGTAFYQGALNLALFSDPIDRPNVLPSWIGRWVDWYVDIWSKPFVGVIGGLYEIYRIKAAALWASTNVETSISAGVKATVFSVARAA